MKLYPMKGNEIKTLLLENGTRDILIEKALEKVKGKEVKIGMDEKDKFTIVQVGKEFGVSKRCTYSGMADKYSLQRGFTLAFLRAIGLSEF